MGENELLNLDHARTELQKKKMQEIIKLGICPFCEENLKKYHDAPIEKRGNWWSVTRNDYPYEGAAEHYLFIYTKHVESLDSLPPEAFAELGALARQVANEKGAEGATLLMRFGNTNWTSGSVAHLHAQLIAGVGRKEGTEKLKIGVGYKKK